MGPVTVSIASEPRGTAYSKSSEESRIVRSNWNPSYVWMSSANWLKLRKNAVHHDPTAGHSSPQSIVRQREASFSLDEMANGKQLPNARAKFAKCVERIRRRERSEHVSVVALHVFRCAHAESRWHGIQLHGERSCPTSEVRELLGPRKICLFA